MAMDGSVAAIARPRRATRIIATLGPASSEPAVLAALVEAGVDLFRLNFSHGSHEEQRRRCEAVRAVAADRGRRIALLQDLQGPKFRIGDCTEDVTLETGQPFVLDMESHPADRRRAGLPHPELFEAILPGQRILLDDGRLELKVSGIGPARIETEVLAGGPLSARKGVNIPDTDLKLPALTEKDRADIAFGRSIGVDWVALSFVQRPSDILDAIAAVEGQAAICAKIEKPSALKHLGEIIALADAVMVARGDLGVELPAEDVPNHQRDILAACRAAGKPAIVATQMLDSMVTRPVPTRAEASDVATAVMAGADAVMLSAETAAGRHPVEAAAMMDRIIRATEGHRDFRSQMDAVRLDLPVTVPHAVTAAATGLAERIGAKALVAFTATGTTAARASRERPAVPIVAVVPDRTIAGRIILMWGVEAVVDRDAFAIDEIDTIVRRLARESGLAGPGDRVVALAGFPFGTPGSTNLVKVCEIA